MPTSGQTTHTLYPPSVTLPQPPPSGLLSLVLWSALPLPPPSQGNHYPSSCWRVLFMMSTQYLSLSWLYCQFGEWPEGVWGHLGGSQSRLEDLCIHEHTLSQREETSCYSRNVEGPVGGSSLHSFPPHLRMLRQGCAFLAFSQPHARPGLCVPAHLDLPSTPGW